MLVPHSKIQRFRLVQCSEILVVHCVDPASPYSMTKQRLVELKSVVLSDCYYPETVLRWAHAVGSTETLPVQVLFVWIDFYLR